MVNSNDYIRIDINSGSVVKKIYVRQADTVMRTLVISSVNSGVPIDLTGLKWASILINKADGYKADNGCVISGNEITYTLRSTDIAALGENTAQIELTFDDGSTLLSPTFTIVVFNRIIDPSIEQSVNEYTSITNQLIECQTYAGQAKSANEYVQAAYSEIVDASALVSEYASSASASKESASTSATSASASATSASGYATAAATSATNASTSESNASASASAASTSESNASASATAAATSASSASASASSASASATEAAEADESSLLNATSASASATSAQSWAVGGTGSREGEDRNNAKYWSDQAQAAAHGQYVLYNGDASETYVEYSEASEESNLVSGENMLTAFSKISKAVRSLISHIANSSNPHSVTASQVGLGNVNNTSDMDKPISTAVGNAIGSLDSASTTTHSNLVSMVNEVNAIAKGRSQAIAFTTYSSLVSTFNAEVSSSLVVGQNAYIGTVGVPDLWIMAVHESNSPYTYVDDATMVSALATNGYITCGFYDIAMLETQKVDLTDIENRIGTLETGALTMHYPS